MREPPGQHVTEQVQAALVERYLRKIGGGVSVSELAYQTRLPESRIIDALYELEEQSQEQHHGHRDHHRGPPRRASPPAG